MSAWEGQSKLIGPELSRGYRGRVLLAEDGAMSRKILGTWLADWGYEVVAAEDGLQAWEIVLREPSPELLILDWVMPGIDGPELCRRTRSRKRTPYQYILIVTAKDAKHDAVQALEAGADDYLTKPFERPELRARVTVAQRILDLQRDLICAREELRFQALHDPLTGIWNRRALFELLHRELDRSARTRQDTGVLVLDVDHFKLVNDNYGHSAGDAVLSEIARRIVSTIRSYDAVGRYGGEEFVVVLPGCEARQLRQSAERIRQCISREPLHTNEGEISITVSIGAAVAEQGENEAKLLTRADAAMYEAKRAGRNRTVLA